MRLALVLLVVLLWRILRRLAQRRRNARRSHATRGFLRLGSGGVAGQPGSASGQLTIPVHPNFRLLATQNSADDAKYGATRHLLLPVGRFHSIWQPLIGALVLYTAVMTPIVLCFDGVPSTLPVGMAAFDVVTDLIFLADVRPRPAPHRRSLPLLARR